MAEQINIGVDLAKVKQDIKDLKTELAGLGDTGAAALNKIGQTGKQVAGQLEAEFNKGVGQGIADALQDAQKEFDDLKKSADILRGAMSRATDPELVKTYAKNIAVLEKGMQDLATAGKQAGVSFDEFNKKTNTSKEVVDGLFGSFAKAAVIIEAIRLLKDFTVESFNLARQVAKTERQFAGFVGGIDGARKALAGFNKTAREVKVPEQEFQKAAKALLGFGFSVKETDTALRRVADVAAGSGKDFNELALIFGKARASGVLFAEDINQLTEAGIPVIGEFAKQMGVSTEQVKKLASEGKIGFPELELAFANLTKAGALYAGQSKANADATDQLSANFQKFKTIVGQVFAPAVNAYIENVNKILDLGISLSQSNGISDFFTRLKFGAASIVSQIPGIETFRKALSKLGGLSFLDPELTKTDGRAAFEKQKSELEDQEFEITQVEQKAAENRLKLAAEANKKKAAEQAEAAKKAREDAERFERERQQLLIDQMKEGEEKEIAQENFKFKILEKELKDHHVNTENAEDAHDKTINEIRLRYYAIRLADIAKAYADEQEAIQRGFDELQNLEAAEVVRKKSVADANKKVQQESAALSGVLFQLEQERASVKFLSVKRTDEEIKAFEKRAAKEREAFQLALQADEIQRTIDFGTELTDVEKSTLETRLAILKTKIEGLTSNANTGGGDKPKSTLLSLLGIDLEDDKTKKGLESAVSLIKKSLDDILQARIDAAQQEVEIQNNRVKEAEDALAKEKELKDAGFANDVALRQKQLDDANAARKKAIEDKKKAQKAELAVDTITQLSNTAVAVSNIIKDYSTIPFVGVLLGIAQVAALFAFLSSARARSKAINAPVFRHGGEGTLSGDGILIGNSHESGGIGIEAEGGEAIFSDGRKLSIVNKQMTGQHFELVKAINKNDKKGMYEYVQKIVGGKERFNHHRSDSAPNLVQVANTEKIERLQRENNRLTSESNKLLSKKRQVIDSGAYITVIEGNRTTKTRK